MEEATIVLSWLLKLLSHGFHILAELISWILGSQGWVHLREGMWLVLLLLRHIVRSMFEVVSYQSIFFDEMTNLSSIVGDNGFGGVEFLLSGAIIGLEAADP